MTQITIRHHRCLDHQRSLQLHKDEIEAGVSQLYDCGGKQVVLDIRRYAPGRQFLVMTSNFLILLFFPISICLCKILILRRGRIYCIVQNIWIAYSRYLNHCRFLGG